MRKTHTFCALLSGFEGYYNIVELSPVLVHGVQMFKLFTFNLRPVKRRCKSPFRYDCRNYRQPYWCWRFFRSMNKKIPHAPGEGMREISWLCLRSIPSTFQHEVDQGGHIVDVDIALQVAVGIGHVDTSPRMPVFLAVK